jgi:GntR family transcriptional regulator
MKRRDATDPTPIYYKLQNMLREEIENGHWIVGERIPPERLLSQIHAVSIGTVKKAILNLVNEGYLYRIQGKGTFVAGMALQPESLRYYRLLNDFEDKEIELQVRLLNLRKTKAIKAINRMLALAKDQQLYEIKRVFLKDNEPIVYSVSYLPQQMFGGLGRFPKQTFEKVPLYLFLEESYGLTTISNKELFSATTADRFSAKVLNAPIGTPLLFIEMVSFTYKLNPYEYRKSYCMTDKKAIFREM